MGSLFSIDFFGIRSPIPDCTAHSDAVIIEGTYFRLLLGAERRHRSLNVSFETVLAVQDIIERSFENICMLYSCSFAEGSRLINVLDSLPYGRIFSSMAETLCGLISHAREPALLFDRYKILDDKSLPGDKADSIINRSRLTWVTMPC